MTRYAKSKKIVASLLVFAMLVSSTSGFNTSVYAQELDESPAEVVSVEDTEQDEVSADDSEAVDVVEDTTEEVSENTDELATEEVVVDENEMPTRPMVRAGETSDFPTLYTQKDVFGDGKFDYLSLTSASGAIKNIDTANKAITLGGIGKASMWTSSGGATQDSTYEFVYNPTPFKYDDRIILKARITPGLKASTSQNGFGIMLNNNIEFGGGDAVYFGLDTGSSGNYPAIYTRNANSLTAGGPGTRTQLKTFPFAVVDGVFTGSYDFELRKLSVNDYVYTVTDVADPTRTITQAINGDPAVEAIFAEGDNVYAGVYYCGRKSLTEEGGDSTFSNISAEILPREYENLTVVNAPAKTSYAPFEMSYSTTDKTDNKPYTTPNITGLKVTALKTATNETVVVDNADLGLSNFDTRFASGDYELKIAYQGLETSTPYTITPNPVSAIEVTTPPTKTDYYLYDNLDTTGMVVKATVDGRLKKINTIDLDISGFDTLTEGSGKTFKIAYRGSETTVPYNVLPQPADRVPVEFTATYFGTSTNGDNNFVNINMPTNGYGNGSVEVASINGSGKITGGDDGIAFYYTKLDKTQNFVLEADVAASRPFGNLDPVSGNYAPSGQEFYGLMARDVIGEHTSGDANSSNTFAVGAFAGGSSKPITSQMWYRIGITNAATGAGNEGRVDKVLDSVNPTTIDDYHHYTLIKNNTGFYGKVNDGSKYLVAYPDALSQQTPDMYVGFAAARAASANFKNIKLTTTLAKDDPPAEVAPAELVSAKIYPLSGETTNNTNYNVQFTVNTPGTVTVVQNGTVILKEKSAKLTERVNVPATIKENANTKFEIRFTPTIGTNVTSYKTIVSTLNVTHRVFEGDIYVAPNGVSTNAGTVDSPVDLQTGINYVGRGQNVIVLDGTYYPTRVLTFPRDTQLNPTQYKTVKAADGAKPVIDFQYLVNGSIVHGTYWHIRGLNITKAAPNNKAMHVTSSNNIIENCEFSFNGDAGLQISRYDNDDVAPSIKYWPGNNLILNCDSHDNQDPSLNNADGFGNKLTTGNGNIFRGCISWNNADDGYDLFAKALTGPIGGLLVEDCVAYGNGFLANSKNEASATSGGNGFKLGGENIATRHVIKNSIAFDNGGSGITSNSDPTIAVGNCVVFNNARFVKSGKNLGLYTNTDITTDFKLQGAISFFDASKYKMVTSSSGTSTVDKDNLFQQAGRVSGSAVDGESLLDDAGTNFLVASAPGIIGTTFTGGTNKAGTKITAGDFESITAPTAVEGTINQLFPRSGANAPDANPTAGTANFVNANGFLKYTGAASGVPFKALPTDIFTPEVIADTYVPINNNNNTSGGGSAAWNTGGVSTGGGSTTPGKVTDNTGNKLTVTTKDGVTTIDSKSATEVKTTVKDLATYAKDSNELVLKNEKVTYTAPINLYEHTDGLASFLTSNNAKFEDLTLDFKFDETEVPTNLPSDVKPLTDMVDVTLTYGLSNGKTFVAEQFSAPVEIAIPVQNIDSNKVYAGVYYDKANGKEKTTTRPVKVVGSDAVITTFTHSAYGIFETNKTFTDVADAWSSAYITESANRLFVNGVTTTQFKPREEVTRAQFVTMVVRGLGIDKVNANNSKAPYSDIKATDWFNDYIYIASDNGLLDGFSGNTFNPNQPITRAEMMLIAFNASKLVSDFDDKVIATEVEVKTDEATDAETVTVKALLSEDYTDNALISPSHIDAVEFALENGIVNGFDVDNTIRPNATTTREESTAILIRLLKLFDLI